MRSYSEGALAEAGLTGVAVRALDVFGRGVAGRTFTGLIGGLTGASFFALTARGDGANAAFFAGIFHLITLLFPEQQRNMSKLKWD